MTRHNIPLGRILGSIPIGLDYSWFLIFALLTWMLADIVTTHSGQPCHHSSRWFSGGVPPRPEPDRFPSES